MLENMLNEKRLTMARLVPSNMFKPSSIFVLTVPRLCYFMDPFLSVVLRVCHALFSVHCSLVVTCW